MESEGDALSTEELLNKHLENCTYRQLQKMAKSMCLPSNFKKIYLIELIHAKKFKSENVVYNIIQRVKQERLRLSKLKKERWYQPKKAQTFHARSNSYSSPPITVTPKRPSGVDDGLSSNLSKAVANFPRRTLLNDIIQNEYNATVSDRVLRSYNLKTIKHDYTLINSNEQELRTDCCSNRRNKKYKIITNRGRFSQLNIASKCVLRKRNADIFIDKSKSLLKQNVVLSHGAGLGDLTPAKRERTISGIYPLRPQEQISRNVTNNQSVCVRQLDGSYKKINAVLQKRNVNLDREEKETYKITEINIHDKGDTIDQSLPDSVIHTGENNNYMEIQYPAIQDITLTTDGNIVVNDNQTLPVDNVQENYLSCENSGDYQKENTEEVRNHKVINIQCEQLPKINDVFANFIDMYVEDTIQPLQVDIGTQPEIDQDNSSDVNCSNDNETILQPLYNIKSYTPLLAICTAAETKSVYSTQTVASVTSYTSTVAPTKDAFDATSLEPHIIYENNAINNFYEFEIRMQDFLQAHSIQTDSDESGVYVTSPSFDAAQTSDDNAMPVNIPEMVDDALEIISQDGDYMEHLGLGMHVQCALCTWAGPKIVLECHIRKEHANDIQKHVENEWNITCTLEGIMSIDKSLHHVIEHDYMLYLLSVKYEDPGSVIATLSSLSTEPEPSEQYVSITIYNKVTGEPFTWSGHIPFISADFPYDSEPKNCLKVDLSKLDLLPNSANLKFVNRELVSASPNKVVVGQSALNDIHIILFVRIYN